MIVFLINVFNMLHYEKLVCCSFDLKGITHSPHIHSAVVTVNFGSSDYSVQENKGSAMVCLTTSIGSERLLNVIVATAPKTASGQ